MTKVDLVAAALKSCFVRKKAESPRSRKHGLLKPLPIPERYWTYIHIDFITPLPVCIQFGRNSQHVTVVVDRLSKKRKFMVLDSLDVESAIEAFIVVALQAFRSLGLRGDDHVRTHTHHYHPRQRYPLWRL